MTHPPTASPDTPKWMQPLIEAGRAVASSALGGSGAPTGTRPRAASVLMLFGADAAGPHVLLLERSHDMRSHAGQIAFPGGAQDPADRDAVDAALREAQEETGLDPDGVTVLETLPSLWLPPSNFAVTPVLGWWRRPSPVYAVDPAETASVHTIGVQELLDPRHRVTMRHPSGYLGPAFCVRGLVVWGFTAGLLSRLFDGAGWERAWDKTRIVDLPADLVAASMRDHARTMVEP